MRHFLFLLSLSYCFTLSAQPEALFRKAEGLSEQGRYEASNELLSEFINTYDNRLYDLGEAHFLRSYNFLQLGQLEKALDENKASLELRQQFMPEDAARNYLRFGQVYAAREKYERALAYYHQAEDFPLIDDPQMASLIKVSIGEAYLQTGAYGKARAAFLQSADILRIEEGEESAGVAKAYAQIGKAYLLEGEAKEAMNWLEKALAIEEQLEENDRRQGELYLLLGRAAERQGGASRAEGYYQRALQAYSGLPDGELGAAARSLLHIARLKIAEEDLKGAEMAVQAALENLCPDFRSKGFEDNPAEGSRIISNSLLAEAMAVKSRAAMASFRAGRGASQLEMALASSLRGMALAGAETENLGGVCETAAAAAFLLYQETGKEAYAEQAFELSERARMAGLPFSTSFPPAGKMAVEKELGKNEALLAYFLSPEANFVMVITNKKTETVSLETEASVIAEGVDTLLKAIQEEKASAFSTSSYQLYQQLLEPVKKQLKRKKELVIVPYGPLTGLPFEVLLTKDPGGEGYAKLDFLIEEAAVRYHHTASGLVYRPAGERGEGLLAVAPFYEPSLENGALASENTHLFNPAYQEQPNLREVAPDGKALLPLIGSEEEIQEARNAFATKADTLLGKEAAEPAFSRQAGKYRYLHIAAYGFTHTINPSLSGIALSQQEASEEADGILFAPEIASLSLDAALVSLPYCACGGPGIFSISQPFLKAGAGQVMASLWLDGQYPANLWVGSFYEKLQKGNSPAEALRQFKTEMLQEEVKAAPQKWAGMILMGL